MPRRIKFLVTVMGCPDGRGGEFTVLEGEERLVSDETFEILRWKRTFDNTPWIVNLVVRSEGQLSEGSNRQRSIAGNGSEHIGDVVVQREYVELDHERFMEEREGHRRRRVVRDWALDRQNGDVHSAPLNHDGRNGTLLRDTGTD